MVKPGYTFYVNGVLTKSEDYQGNPVDLLKTATKTDLKTIDEDAGLATNEEVKTALKAYLSGTDGNLPANALTWREALDYAQYSEEENQRLTNFVEAKRYSDDRPSIIGLGGSGEIDLSGKPKSNTLRNILLLAAVGFGVSKLSDKKKRRRK